MSDEIKALVEQLEAWAPLVSSGYEVPAAGQAMMNASRTLTAQADEIERLRARNDALTKAAGAQPLAEFLDEMEADPEIAKHLPRARAELAALKAAQEVKA